MEYLDEQDVRTVRKRLALSGLAGPDFGADRPLRPDQLSSAVGRQTAGMGSMRKYTTIEEVAATLFFGMTQNHPFENGNKRTALVCMLVLLQKNRMLLTGATEDELYEMAKDVAAHTFPIAKGVERTSDSEVAAIAQWIREKARALVLGDRLMMYKDLRTQLLEQGCDFLPPKRNYVKIRRTTKTGTYSVKLGYPKANFQVHVRDVKRVRRTLKLDESHGFDSDAFYTDVEGVVDSFINEHRHLLDRLALI